MDAVSTNEDGSKHFLLAAYDPREMMQPDMTVVCVGMRGSGKTMLMRYLLCCMQDKLDLVTVFCPTRDTYEEYMKHVPRCCVYTEFSTEKLKVITETQKLIAQAGAASHNSSMDHVRRVGIVMDDCMFEPKEMKSDTMRYLFMNGRHDKLFFMNGVQYVMSISKDVRSQIDVSIVFPRTEPAFITALRENMLGDCFDTDQELCATFKTLRPHEALVYDARARRAGKPYLFYIKAPLPVPDFRIGSDTFWRLYYKYMRPFSNVKIKRAIKDRLQQQLGRSGNGSGAYGSGSGSASGAGTSRNMYATPMLTIDAANAAGGTAGVGAGAGAGSGAPRPMITVQRADPPPAMVATSMHMDMGTRERERGRDRDRDHHSHSHGHSDRHSHSHSRDHHSHDNTHVRDRDERKRPPTKKPKRKSASTREPLQAAAPLNLTFT
jgi:hypothetical protein